MRWLRPCKRRRHGTYQGCARTDLHCRRLLTARSSRPASAANKAKEMTGAADRANARPAWRATGLDRITDVIARSCSLNGIQSVREFAPQLIFLLFEFYLSRFSLGGFDGQCDYRARRYRGFRVSLQRILALRHNKKKRTRNLAKF